MLCLVFSPQIKAHQVIGKGEIEGDAGAEKCTALLGNGIVDRQVNGRSVHGDTVAFTVFLVFQNDILR